MTKIILRICSFIAVCGALVLACSKHPDDFKNFYDGHEIVYPGVPTGVVAQPGNLRTGLAWSPSPDPNIIKYVIYWNNQKDSLLVNASSHDSKDTIRALIPGLNEYIYSFTIYSVDSAGNRSVPFPVNNVRVYGPVYQAGLLNRPYNADTPFILSDAGPLTLYFGTPDTINISTGIRYTNTQGNLVETPLGPDKNSITLNDWKFGTLISYQSSFIPVQGAIDTFKTLQYDTLPAVYKIADCDKSLFRAVHMPNDVDPYDPGSTTLDKLWDGSVGPQAYPDIFHSNGAVPIPQHLTFDMGAVYDNIANIEETGRNCCNNPDDFEVWGIADTTGATTLLPGNDPGWKAESIAKGWTLLKEVIRTDDGQAPFKVNLIPNPPPVRFIRIRVLHVTTNDPNYSNMSEVTLQYKKYE